MCRECSSAACLQARGKTPTPTPLLCCHRLRLSALLALESPLFSNDFPPPRPQLSHAKRRQLRRPAATSDTMLSAGGAAASLALLMLLPLLCCCHLCHSLRKFWAFLFLLDCCLFTLSASNCNSCIGMQTMFDDRSNGDTCCRHTEI